jgi:predicted nucleic acid-binding protein
MTNVSPAFLIDTNILLYAVDSSEATKQERAFDVFDHLLSSGAGTLSVQVLGEFFSVATRARRRLLSVVEAEEYVRDYTAAWQVLDLTRSIQALAMLIVRRYEISYWDALIVATASLNQIAFVLSEDMQDGQIIEGVRIVNPLVPDFDLSRLD